MNDLCADIGYNSLNKFGEELCGDHVEVIEHGDDSMVVVLADGMGSGVKACILSTLTSKIISTMMAAGMSIEDCVETIAQTLPVCSVRGVAYSTFTIIHIVNGREAEIIQYDNPQVIMLREGKNLPYETEALDLAGKHILKSRIRIQEGDIFVALSDGAPHAGIGVTLNLGWKRENIIDFLETYSHVGFTAKTLTTLLLDECYSLYGGKPGDDTTVCALKIRKREPLNLVIGPPSNPADCNKMMSLFFSKEGKHVVCGGTTSGIAAEFLGKQLLPSLDYYDKDIPPTAEIEGVDLTTEGVITINRVLDYAQDYLNENDSYKQWSSKKDGASRLARLLFEEATDINFFVGTAINPAHQNPNLPISFNIKMRLVDQLSECLKKMGKKIKVSYF
ncbi:MAG: SpoIIE family protein phosphatase [Clostridiales bacterium]|nr:SpoIIE family protein phosphatase [Clostridiales bacterium]